MLLLKPQFWDKKQDTIFSIILIPLSIIYYLLIFFKEKLAKQKKFGISIICVGNIYIGGTGKTISAIEIFKIISKYKKTCFLTKGYGRKASKDFFLYKKNTKKYTTDQIGDESFLLNKFGPTYVSYNRKKAINIIKDKGFEAIILDDGFQDKSIFKDINFLCFDSENWIGNGRLLPSGPLRECLKSIKEANYVIIKGNKNQKIENSLKKINNKIKFFYLENKIKNLNKYKKNNFIAFAGIGNPKSFFKILKNNNIKVVKEYIYPDHYNFKKDDYTFLFKQSINNHCKLITTEKDFMRIKSPYKNKLFFIKLINKIINNNILEKEIKNIL